METNDTKAGQAMGKLPNELFIKILGQTDVRSLSQFACSCKQFNEIVKCLKWEVIDKFQSRVSQRDVPSTRETFNNFRYYIDINTLIYNDISLPDTVITEIGDQIELNVIATYQKLPEDVIDNYWDKITWRTLLFNQQLNGGQLLRVVANNELNSSEWNHLWRKQRVSFDFVQKYVSHVDWYALSENKDSLDLQIISTYCDQLYWPEISKHGLHEDILTIFVHKLDFVSWRNVSYFSKLSIGFILQHLPKLHVLSLITSQDLTEELIIHFVTNADEFDIDAYWNKIASNQCLSKDFIQNYKDNLPRHLLIRNPKILRSILVELYPIT